MNSPEADTEILPAIPDLFATMPTELRPRLRAFALVMEAKLRKNDHKREWTEFPVKAHLRRLMNEIAELEMAIDFESDANVMKECADCANFCLFIFDQYRTGTHAKIVRTKEKERVDHS
jgi:NTP pyrophosphatase (non-canonical NTP hydrolase)